MSRVLWMRFSILSKAFHSTRHAAWRNWHASSRRIVSGTTRSEDNENNRHLFLSSVVSSILRIVCRSTYESWPLSFCHLYMHTYTQAQIEAFYMRSDLYIRSCMDVLNIYTINTRKIFSYFILVFINYWLAFLF